MVCVPWIQQCADHLCRLAPQWSTICLVYKKKHTSRSKCNLEWPVLKFSLAAKENLFSSWIEKHTFIYFVFAPCAYNHRETVNKKKSDMGFVAYTIKTFELLQPYFGHLSCMPVVYGDTLENFKGCFQFGWKLETLLLFVTLGSSCRKPSYLDTFLPQPCNQGSPPGVKSDMGFVA